MLNTSELLRKCTIGKPTHSYFYNTIHFFYWTLRHNRICSLRFIVKVQLFMYFCRPLWNKGGTIFVLKTQNQYVCMLFFWSSIIQDRMLKKEYNDQLNKKMLLPTYSLIAIFTVMCWLHQFHKTQIISFRIYSKTFKLHPIQRQA